MNIKKLLYKVSFSLFLIVVSFLASSAHVKADPLKPIDITGWAWSSNIGWISFNCSNMGTCGTGAGKVDYGVKLATSSSDALAGTLSGYAWSSNIGWIKFAGDASLGFPSPTVDLDKGAVSGYIRVCSGTVNNDCTGADRTDGWNGWAKLSESPLYPTRQNSGGGGITYITSDGSFVGYSWAGENLGWLKFNAASPTSNTVRCPGCTGTNMPVFTPTCTIASPVTYTSPQTSGTATVSASSIDGTAPYTFSPPTLANLPAGPYISSSITVKDSSVPQKTGTMSCSFTVVNGSPVPPGINMWTMDSQTSVAKTKFLVAVRKGQDAYVNWEAVGGMAYDVNSCVANLKPPSGSVQILSGLSSQSINGYYKIPAALLTTKGDYKYSMTCTDSNNAPVFAKSTDPSSASTLTIKVKDPKEIEK